ncbi:MAG: hypothetical protein ACP5D5_09135 [Acidithiobacillus sp.]|uniref:hypothetical protein n=1 Tax=Acidithiobacillus sp. TaxID=1872118 RepID=UPI003D027C81
MAKPRFQPTPEQREMVRMLSGVGTRAADICLLVKNPATGKPIDEKTLRLHFREELDEGAVQANARVAKTLFNFATDPKGGMKAVTAGIFWLKTRSGWKETAGLEVSGPDGGPVPTQVTAIRRTIIDPRHSDPEDIPPAP